MRVKSGAFWRMIRDSFLIGFLFIGISVTSQVSADSFFNPGGSKIKEGLKSFHSKDYDKAMEEFEKAEKDFPSDPRLEFNKGTALLKGGRVNEAIPHLEKSLEIPDETEKSQSYFNLGKAYSKLGQKRKALDSYRKALEYNPGFAEAKKNLELLYKSSNNPNNSNNPDNPNNSGDPSNSSKPSDSNNPSDESSQDKNPSQNSQNNPSNTDGDNQDSENKSNGSDSDQDPMNSKNTDQSDGNPESNDPERKSKNSNQENSSDRLSPEEAESIMDSFNADDIKRNQKKKFLQPRREKFW